LLKIKKLNKELQHSTKHAANTDAAGDKFMRNHAILPSSHLKQARLLVEYGIAPARALMIALHNLGSAACRQGFPGRTGRM
jgi:hypothetical protein